eukprot:16447092-Heterocapsa_arctica.AAC.1
MEGHAVTRHGGLRARGRPKRCGNTTEASTPGASGPWGAAGGGAVVVYVAFSHRFGRPCARNYMPCYGAPLSGTRPYGFE